jgi:hypothetical protein
MSNADWRNRGVPSAAEFEHAVRDLSGAGLIRADGVQFSLTDSGQALWRQTQSQETGAHSQLVYARDQMEAVPCVSSNGGWSLDQGRWEDALASYSAQFALERKRRDALIAGGLRLPRELREQIVVAMASPRRGDFLRVLADSLAFSAESHGRGRLADLLSPRSAGHTARSSRW